jgi:hypothetical protein
MWDLWWTKLHWGMFSPSTSVSPANSHSTEPLHIHHHHHHHHHLSSRAGTIGQLVADVRSGLSLTPPQETKRKSYFSCNAVYCIREILTSSTGWNTSYTDCYSWLSFASAGKSQDSVFIRLTLLRFKSLPIHQPSYNVTLYPLVR